ncbi:MAG: hypothetical protein RIN56_07030 [Sporomusaceae bacterium]|nr:hypothetical protein [Sporomusaceae bacterium]
MTAFDKLRGIIIELKKGKFSPADMEPGTMLVEDLKPDSLDLAELLVLMENEFSKRHSRGSDEIANAPPAGLYDSCPHHKARPPAAQFQRQSRPECLACSRMLNQQEPRPPERRTGLFNGVI